MVKVFRRYNSCSGIQELVMMAKQFCFTLWTALSLSRGAIRVRLFRYLRDGLVIPTPHWVDYLLAIENKGRIRSNSGHAANTSRVPQGLWANRGKNLNGHRKHLCAFALCARWRRASRGGDRPRGVYPSGPTGPHAGATLHGRQKLFWIVKKRIKAKRACRFMGAIHSNGMSLGGACGLSRKELLRISDGDYVSS